MSEFSAVQAEAIIKATEEAETGKNPKYRWEQDPNGGLHTAVGWNGQDEIGRILMVTDPFEPSRKWMWSVTAGLAKDRESFVCAGWTKTSFQAAAAVEATYDLLMP